MKQVGRKRWSLWRRSWCAPRFGAPIAGIDCGILGFSRAASSPGRQAAEVGAVMPGEVRKSVWWGLETAEIWLFGGAEIYRWGYIEDGNHACVSFLTRRPRPLPGRSPVSIISTRSAEYVHRNVTG
jgi:hypothetical protein